MKKAHDVLGHLVSTGAELFSEMFSISSYVSLPTNSKKQKHTFYLNNFVDQSSWTGNKKESEFLSKDMISSSHLQKKKKEKRIR